jgi:protein phosphatase
LERSLADALKEQDIAVDWDEYAKLAAAADSAGKHEPVAAFRLRCESLLFLAEAFHRSRHKQESFRPNWTPPPGT